MMWFQQLGVPYTKQHLNNIVKALDNNSDGKIYYGYVINMIFKLKLEARVILM